jgi:predicted aspartyl protease
MNHRIAAGLLLLAFCSCSKQPTTVVATTQNVPPPVVDDQSAINAHLKAQAEANGTVKHSAAGETLLRDGYGFVKLMRDNSSKLYVNCVANGKVFCLNVDTGFTCTSIAEETAKTLGLSVRDADVKIMTVGSEGQRTRAATLEGFHIGDQLGSAFDVNVTDFSALRERAKEDGQVILDGVLGANWLHYYSCVIDFKNDVLYYTDPSRFRQTDPEWKIESSAFGAALLKDGYGYAKLARGKVTPDLFLNCKAQGKDFCFAIDSGSSKVFISEETATRLGLLVGDSADESAWLGSKPIKEKSTTLVDVRLHSDLPPIGLVGVGVVDFSALKAYAKQSANVKLDGLLSAQLLSLFSCVLDFQHGVLYFMAPFKQKLGAFSGSWQATRVVKNGKLQAADRIKSWQLNFVEGQINLEGLGAKWQCSFATTPNSTNGTIDCHLLIAINAEVNSGLFGIYEFGESANKMKICMSSDPANRPTKMESGENSRNILIELERVPRRLMPPPEK